MATAKQTADAIAKLQEQVVKLQAEVLELRATRKPKAPSEPSPRAKAFAIRKWLMEQHKGFYFWVEPDGGISVGKDSKSPRRPIKDATLEAAKAALGF